MSYQQLGGNTVVFRVESRWRRSFSSKSVFAGSGADGRAITGDVVDVPGVQVSDQGIAGPVVLRSGDGAEYPLTMTVTAHSVAEDYIFGFSLVEHTYPSPNNGGNDWIASLKGCCREYGGLQEAGFEAQARVNLAFDSESLRARALPLLSLHEATGVQQLLIAASSPSGGLASGWRIGEGTEVGGGVMPAASQVFFDPAGPPGYLSVDTDALPPGIHPVVVQIAFFRSVTPFDFALQVVPAALAALVPFFDGNPLKTSNVTGEPPPVLTGYVGYEIFFTIAARTQRAERRVAAIRSFSLPAGAALVNAQTSGFAGDHGRRVDFKWTPLPSQANQHLVCFDAVDDAPTAPILSSLQSCVRLVVTAANPSPQFASPPENATIRFFLAVPNAFTINGTNDNPYDNLLLFPREPLLDGQLLSPPVATEKRVRATDPALRVSASSELTWKPAITLGAYAQTVCFVLSQQGGPGTIPQSKQRCVRLVVERCKYVTQAGDSMQLVGQIFESDWLSLWALNVELKTFDPPTGSTLLIGRLYIVQRGDTLQSIASEFGTSIEGIRNLNYDLRSESAVRELPSGSSICIFPDTCTE